MINKRAGYCAKCGHLAEPGNILVRWFNDDEDRYEWLVYHTDKSVCEANIAADKAAKAAKEAAEAEWQAFRLQFKDAERPNGPIDLFTDPTAEVLLDTFDIYGGGSAIVLTPEYVWLVYNNGMDGDNWSYNNVRTGGAGAIGRRLPRTDELEAVARKVAAK